MKKFITLFSILICGFLSAQSEVATFDFDRDVELYNRLSTMKKADLWESVEIKYDMKDSALIEGRSRYIKTEWQVISTGSDDKSKVTGVSLNMIANDIETWFSPRIENYFKKFGKPSEKINSEKIILNSKSYDFENGYVWDIIYKGTKAKTYVGYVTKKTIVRNKKGKIKKVLKRKIGVEYTLPVSSKSVAPEYLNFLNEVVKVGSGFINSYKNDVSLKRVLSDGYNEKFFESGIETASLVLFRPSDPDSAKGYLDSFVLTAFMMYDINLKNSSANLTFSSLPSKTIAIAKGMDNNCDVDLMIDIKQWNDSSYLERLHIIFHELGHDYFNLNHSDGLRLMATNKFQVDNPEILGDMIQEMFSYVKKVKLVDSYTCN